jgi:hypothetical protein
MLSCRQHHENGALVAGVIRAPTSTENAFAVVPQNVEAVISFSAGEKLGSPRASGVKPSSRGQELHPTGSAGPGLHREFAIHEAVWRCLLAAESGPYSNGIDVYFGGRS